MKYDPVLMRTKMLEKDDSDPRSMLDYFLARSVTPNAMGNMAASYVDDIIKFWLIGLHNEVAPMLPKIIQWLTTAIEQGEDFGRFPHYNRYLYHSSFALAKWLQSGDAATQGWAATRELALANLTDEVWGKSKIKTEGLDDYLSVCIQAEQYQAGIDGFEKYHGAKKISLKKTLSPREFGYALCLNEIKPQFAPDDLLAAGRKMLQANLEDHPWLGYGQYSRATQWLKIVYWNNNRTLTPLETILKAYDNMPNVARPSFTENKPF